MRFTNAIGYAALLVVAGLLFHPFWVRLATGVWPNTVAFPRTINLRAQGIGLTRLPYSHHNSRHPGGDFFIFEQADERYASEESVIEANQRFWKHQRVMAAGGKERTIFLLQPFSVFFLIISRLALFFLFTVLWIPLIGLVSDKIGRLAGHDRRPKM